jgi:hypothetical protein
MAFQTLNNYLPEELSLMALDYTGKTYEHEKSKVIEELMILECDRINTRWYEFMETTDFDNRGPVDGIFNYPDLAHWTWGSSMLTSMEILMDDDTTNDQWEQAKEVMTNCDDIGMSLYEALELVYHYVFNQAIEYPELAVIYAENTDE